MNTSHPLHHVISALHIERQHLLKQLEGATIAGANTESLCIKIRESRAATRAILWFLNDEVLTANAPLEESR